MRYAIRFMVLAAALLVAAGCSKPEQSAPVKPVVLSKSDQILKDLGYTTRASDAKLKAMNQAFVDVKVQLPLEGLSKDDQQFLTLLIAAADVVDELYWKQVSPEGPKLWEAFQKLHDSDTLTGNDYYLWRLLSIHYGRYDRLDEDKPFIGDGHKPLGATFWPENLTKESLETYLKEHPAEKDQILNWYSVVRYSDENTSELRLHSIPYSDVYPWEMRTLTSILQEAADYADTDSMKKFLWERAKGFLTNDYRDGDAAWVNAESKYPFVCGPTEQYEDGMTNQKATAEAYVMVTDPKLSEELAKIGQYLPAMEEAIPLPNIYRNYKSPKIPPISVVDVLYSAGEGRRGVQTSAFNLPNDEWVGKNIGTRKVMFRNIMQKKFELSLTPIVARLLVAEQQSLVTWEVYFRHALHHELTHALGPGIIQVERCSKPIVTGEGMGWGGGCTTVETTVRKELKDLGGTVEECKADLLGYWSVQFLVGKGYYTKDWLDMAAASSLATVFRSVRFGLNEAHAKGVLMIYNYLTEKGAYIYDSTSGRFHVDVKKFFPAVHDMSQELMVLQATGNYQGTKAFMDKYQVMTPVLEQALAKLQDIPVDLRPIYVTAQKFRQGR